MDQLVAKIHSSKKYRELSRLVVERVVLEMVEEYGFGLEEEEARNKLHQIWGAFWAKRPKYLKLKKEFDKCMLGADETKNCLKPLLNVHASTKERIDLLDDFYGKIWEVTGKPNNILDLACGFNPLTIPWMNLEDGAKYVGCDISEGQVDFLKSILQKIKMNVELELKTADLLKDDFEEAELVLLLKTLPCLEQQKKDFSLELLRKLKAKWLVVSFPTKSLTKKEKGMEKYYAQWFEDLAKGENWEINKIIFENELVFVVKKVV